MTVFDGLFKTTQLHRDLCAGLAARDMTVVLARCAIMQGVVLYLCCFFFFCCLSGHTDQIHKAI
jgi:hypothetical protein